MQTAAESVAASSAVVDELSTDLDDIDTQLQTIADMQAALAGTLDPDREAELLAAAHAGAVAAVEPDWQTVVASQIAHVDQTWAEARPYVEEPDWGAMRADEDAYMARHAEAVRRYEEAVQQVGKTIGDEADRIAESRLASVQPEPLGPSRRDVLGAKLEYRTLKFQHDRGENVDARALRAAKKKATALEDEFYDTQSPMRTTPVGRMRAQVYRELLNEIRPLGGALPETTGRVSADLAEQLASVSNDVPAEWITDINNRKPPLTLRHRKNVRAYFSEDLVGNNPTIMVSGRHQSEMVHEFSHRLEVENPALYAATHEFRRRRTTEVDGTQEPLRHYGNRGSGEKVRPDGFVDSYIGKYYKFGNYTEVFSTGVEALFCGRFGGLVGDGDVARTDLEHRNLILGLFASAKVRTP